VYTADSFGITSTEEWRLEMEKEEAWMQENNGAVQRAVIELESEWPQTVAAIRDTQL